MRTGRPPGLFYRRGLRAARHIVANSEFARRTFVVPTGAADRCTVIPNALLFPELFAPAPAPAGPPVLLNVARFDPEKRQRDLLAAVALLPPDRSWRLEFVGEGPERPACRRLATRLGLAERVTFHGWLDNPCEPYRRASFAVLASQRESLPNFLIEAQAAGVPAVTVDVGGAAECLQPGRSGLVVPPGDTAALAQAIDILLADPERRTAMGGAARLFARERFAPERAVAAHLELFARLAG